MKSFFIQAINKQFEIAGHDLDYTAAQNEKDWFNKYTMTTQQHEDYKKWFIKAFQKKYKGSKKRAEHEFLWFDLGWGLRIIK